MNKFKYNYNFYRLIKSKIPSAPIKSNGAKHYRKSSSNLSRQNSFSRIHSRIPKPSKSGNLSTEGSIKSDLSFKQITAHNKFTKTPSLKRKSNLVNKKFIKEN